MKSLQLHLTEPSLPPDTPVNTLLPSTSERSSFSFSRIVRSLLGGKTSAEPQRTPRSAPVPTRRWRLLQVESTLACNIRCIMCPWKDFRAKAAHHGIMPAEVWDAIRPHLDQVVSVDFTGGGEPLLQPRLARWIADAKEAGCEAGILTNGLILTHETAQRLVSAGLDWLCVSIDASDKDEYERIRVGSDFEQVCANLANLASIRSNGIPKTMINFVIMTSNEHQLEEMVRLAASLGVDQVNFKQCEVIRGEHGKGLGVFGTEMTPQTKRRQKSLAKAEKLAASLKVRTTTSSFTPSQRPVCEQDPRDSLFIRHDGMVAPCISLAYGGVTTFLGEEVAMPSVHYGCLPDDDLLKIWESPSCIFYRERFQQRVRIYEKTFMDGLMSDSLRTPERLHEEAVKRMDEAPEGCRVCHYLYGI